MKEQEDQIYYRVLDDEGTSRDILVQNNAGNVFVEGDIKEVLVDGTNNQILFEKDGRILMDGERRMVVVEEDRLMIEDGMEVQIEDSDAMCVEIEEDVGNEKVLGGLDEGELVEDEAIRVVEEGDLEVDAEVLGVTEGDIVKRFQKKRETVDSLEQDRSLLVIRQVFV